MINKFIYCFKLFYNFYYNGFMISYFIKLFNLIFYRLVLKKVNRLGEEYIKFRNKFINIVI